MIRILLVIALLFSVTYGQLLQYRGTTENSWGLYLSSSIPLSLTGIEFSGNRSPINLTSGFGEMFVLVRVRQMGDLTSYTPIVGIGVVVHTGAILPSGSTQAKAIALLGLSLSIGPGIHGFGSLFVSGGYNFIGMNRMILIGFSGTLPNLVEIIRW